MLLEHCRVVMYITGSSEKIENSILHGSPSRTIIDVEGGGDTESNDFVFDYNDEGEEISRDLKNQACQQYCIFLNEPNPIYVSLFGEVKTPHMDIGDAWIHLSNKSSMFFVHYFYRLDQLFYIPVIVIPNSKH